MLRHKPADFVTEHVEARGSAGFERVLALDHRLVNLGAAFDVVALDGQEFLKNERRPVGFERPDFHFSEPLPAEAGLAAQRLLRDERVRTGRPCVDLVVDQVMQLQHVDHADGDPLLERLAGAAVVEHGLAVLGQPGLLEGFLDGLFARPVEDRAMSAGNRAWPRPNQDASRGFDPRSYGWGRPAD